MSYEWKWSIGEAYYKSARRSKIVEIKEEDTQKNAIVQSLSEEFRNVNRREILDDKMADREMLGQIGSNPFLQSSYVNDVVVRDMFLKPINTTQGKNKENKDENIIK
jgi:hypothetical protein